MNGPEAKRPQDNRRTLRRIRGLTLLFMAGLVASGLTAIPLESELACATKWFGPPATGSVAAWLTRVSAGVSETGSRFPFLAYGTDWLAFGHFVIALAFVGALRDPVRNRWLYQFGLIACVLVVPYAVGFGSVRGIPAGWRLVDCSFGVAGFLPVWLAWRWTGKLESADRGRSPTAGGGVGKNPCPTSHEARPPTP
jgi:hypothetical protein